MQNTWIFQLERPLSEEQKTKLENGLGKFVREGWKAHGAPVPGNMEIRYDRFLIIQAEPGSTSGCSIDSMTKKAKEWMHKVEIHAMEAQYVFYKDDEGEIQYLDFRELPVALELGHLGPDSTVFHTHIQPGETLETFEQPLKETWMKRYLTASTKV